MTSRPENILNFIRQFHKRHGYAPTRREIGRKLNLSTSVVSYRLALLEDEGYLTVAKGIARGIVLTEGAAKVTELDKQANILATAALQNPGVIDRQAAWAVKKLVKVE